MGRGDRLRDLLAPPSLGDAAQDRRARLLYWSLLLTFPVLVVATAWGLLCDTVSVLLEGTPKGLDPREVIDALDAW